MGIFIFLVITFFIAKPSYTPIVQALPIQDETKIVPIHQALQEKIVSDKDEVIETSPSPTKATNSVSETKKEIPSQPNTLTPTVTPITIVIETSSQPTPTFIRHEIIVESTLTPTSAPLPVNNISVPKNKMDELLPPPGFSN